jgi:hypothetical protein
VVSYFISRGVLNFLELRESNLRYSPLHAAAAGSRLTYGGSDWPKNMQRDLQPDFPAVVRLLLDAKTRVDARDICGHTPLSLACNSLATDVSLEVGRLLVAHGADPNATTRDGMSMLVEPARSSFGARPDVFRFLLELGAAPDRPFPGSGGKSLREVFVMMAEMRQMPQSIIDALDAHCASSNRLADGTHVHIRGLSSRPELNGCLGVILGYRADRYEVEVTLPAPHGESTTSRMRLKPGCVQEVPSTGPAITAGTKVVISGLQSRPEMNGKRGVVKAFSQGRYEVIPDGETVGVRLKPEAVSPVDVSEELPKGTGDELASGAWPQRTNGVAASTNRQNTTQEGGGLVDPRRLEGWSGPGSGASHLPNPSKNSPLQWCFAQAIPLEVRPMLASEGADDGADRLTPNAQWLWSLFHIAKLWEGDGDGEIAAGRGGRSGGQPHASFMWRVILEDRSERANVTIDLLCAPLLCPASTPTARTCNASDRMLQRLEKLAKASKAEVEHHEQREYVEPLLSVRYMWNGKADAQLACKLATMTTAVPGNDAATDAAIRSLGVAPQHVPFPTGVAKVHAASVAEVDCAVAYLRANEARLSPKYVAEFFKASPLHNHAEGFRPSFIVPPPEEEEQVKPLLKCAACDFTTEDKKQLKWCARCNGTPYCSKECQKRHWKEHKQVCSKTTDELRDAADCSSQIVSRSSVVASLLPPAEMAGQVMVSMSHIGSARRAKPQVLDPNVAPRNIHGDREFIVKVQVPTTRPTTPTYMDGCCVYDEGRSLNVHVPLTESGMDKIVAMIRSYGQAGGMKGYFFARRDGTNIRIFSDSILPGQPW